MQVILPWIFIFFLSSQTMGFQLTSNRFQEGQRIPKEFTCEGKNISPQLQWKNPPPKTKSFILICEDPDAPGGTWHHWGVYNIPSDKREKKAGEKLADIQGVGTVFNDFKKANYGGPCPPKGHGIHHYHFRIMALDVDHLDLHPKAKVSDLIQKARPHLLGHAEIMGTYSR